MDMEAQAARRKTHWDGVYAKAAPDRVSWYRPHLETSLRLIEEAAESAGGRGAAIFDAGGGHSTLVDDLVARGFRSVTVCDVAEAALNRTKERMGEAAALVKWVVGDVLTVPLPESFFDVWHDRAVFHFLRDAAERAAYLAQMTCALRPNGHVVMATFGPEGPTKCSGLEVCRYDATALAETLGPQFKLVKSLTETHQTPFGTEQQFLACHFRRA
ncbi:MAG TPA: class I SAM-dependent methyltransferase [Terracidiphilus sp.]|nr:class I SAM-dependent methyltransferase [Terracidiphilus sp.]